MLRHDILPALDLVSDASEQPVEHLETLTCLPAAETVLARVQLQLGTGELNRLFEEAVAHYEPPHFRGKPWKLYYATQVGTAPPTFMLFANRTLERRDTYRRYLENRVRQQLDLGGVPLRLVIWRR